jgi:hypothetical protein
LAGARLISSASSRLVIAGGGRVQHRVAGDVGRHQVGRELHARVAQRHGLGQRPRQQRLAQAGHAFDQHVAAGDQRDQGLVHRFLLPDHGLADFGAQLLQQFRGAGQVLGLDGLHGVALG